MKFVLLFGTVSAALLGALSLESKPWSETGNWPILSQGHSAYALPYPTPTPIGYTINSLPISVSHGIKIPAENLCDIKITDQTILDYRHAVHNLVIPVLKKTAQLSNGHFVMSPYTIWLTMAALAEGSSGPAKEELFQYLQLPSNICERQKYYHLATTRELATSDIVLGRNRAFVVDPSVHINKNWEEYVKLQTHLDTKLVPFKSNPFVEIESLKKVFKVHLPGIDLSGNSIVLESLDYHGLWANTFTDAIIEEGPFHNDLGESIGNLEYMKTTKKAIIGYVPGINMKVLDLPVGREGRYRMYFAICEDKEEHALSLNKLKQNILIDTILSFKQTHEPVDIVIPKLSMTSEIDMRYLLEEIGIKSLWSDPYGTRNISEPAALPTAYVQRVTITLDNGGVHPSLQEYHSFVPDVPSFVSKTNTTRSELPDQSYAKSFIANKPFFFGLIDSETLTTIFSASFTKLLSY